MKTEYKHIKFVKSNELEEGKPKWFCVNKSGIALCDVTYYPKWKKYVDEREPSVIFDAACHRDMAHFLEQLDNEI